MIFFVAEITASTPGTSTISVSQGHGTHPHGTLAELADQVSNSGFIYASDAGYRSLSTDAIGLRAYPPLLAQAFAIDRRLNLDPGNSAVAAAWGSAVLANPNGQFDSIAASWNSVGRDVKILWGTKGYDTARGYLTDPAYASLANAFIGLAGPWFLSDTGLQIPLGDATALLTTPLQSTSYGGTGTYDGTADLAGQPKPKARGGTAGNPIRNVTPVLIDPTNRIYQYTDGPGTVVNLYEGGALTITRQVDTTNLYVGTTTSGQFRTDNSRGLFQLGTSPVHAITADITGQFPVAGVVTKPASIARYLMTEDMGLPAANINTASFTAADTSFSYTAGVYFAPSDSPSGIDAVSRVLSAIGAKLVPFRDGTLRIFVLRALAATASPIAAFDTNNTVSVQPQPLPATLDPPPYRVRVGYNHNYTVQTSDLNNATGTAAQLQFIATADRYQSFASNTILSTYRHPNDLAPFGGALLASADAQTVANDIGALWSTRRRLYTVTLPQAVALLRDIGDVVRLTWPMDDLRGGKLGQVVGEQFNSMDNTISLQVLV